VKSKQKIEWYIPLAPQFCTIEDSMPMERFAAIEAVLHLLTTNAPDADPQKAYLLFTQYHLIGATECSGMEHILQQARYTLGYYRSKKYWQDDLRQYRESRYAAIRAFSFREKGGETSCFKSEEAYPYPYEKRREEWSQFWTEKTGRDSAVLYAEQGKYHYLYRNSDNGESEKVRIKFDNEHIVSTHTASQTKVRKEKISITLDELLDTAKQMTEICPNDPCYTILQSNMLKKIEDTSVKTCAELSIHEITNIVGMVGSGKSTLIKVLAFWCHQHGYRVAIVLDTVAEVLNLQKYLSRFGVTVSPLIGRGNRLKYINQVAQLEENCLHAEFSGYLTANCLIDGLDTQHSKAIDFGEEPCYSLKKDNRNHLCPYFNRCAGTKMLRECYTSSVVLTTVAGFATSRVGERRETFLELVMRDFDLVIFDECDRVQKTLDQLFMPETSFNSFIQECADDCSAYMRLTSKSREENLAMQRYDELQRQSVTVLSCIVKSLRRGLGAWNKITYGDPFSALMLLENLYEEESEYKIPRFVYKQIYDLIDVQEKGMRHSTLWTVLESSCKSTDDTFFDQMYNGWINELGAAFPRPQKDKARRIQDARLKLIMRLIYFDHFVRGLSEAYDASHETSYGQNELFGFLQTRFRQQQFLLPSALCGNLFGMKKTDEEDICLYRQFAFGRSLMKDLPYLKTDVHGNPMGPHVVLLSGSSWAEGSYEYHVNRPVNYILEANSDKRAFLEKTCFFESGFPERISGAADDQRTDQLRIVTKKTVDLIIREYERKAGKILLVVNSYVQAQEVQEVLGRVLRKVNSPISICRMISDASETRDEEGAVRRGEVGRFAEMKEDILIAPAMAIERGHNIVDERGHSALSAVFFMVRPMPVPNDIQQAGSKLNGLAEAQCKRNLNEPMFAYNARMRQFASQQWAKMSRSKAFGLADLDEEARRDIVATLFILILQIFGRLARVTDVTKPEPHIYFIDGAFRRREEKPDDFDCLSELGRYLDTLMTQKESKEIAETLYAPFYEAYRKDIQYEQ